jgi:hypothetical protein
MFSELQKFLHLKTHPRAAGNGIKRNFRHASLKRKWAQVPAPQILISSVLATVVMEKKVYYRKPEKVAKFSIAPYLVQTAVIVPTIIGPEGYEGGISSEVGLE